MKAILKEVLMMYITSSAADIMYAELEQDAQEVSNNNLRDRRGIRRAGRPF